MDQRQKAIKLYEKANKFYLKSKHIDAVNHYRKAIKALPQFPEAYSNLGNVLKDMGRHSEALNAYQQALKFYPDHPLILNNLGNMYQLTGKSVTALKYFDKAISIEGKFADAYSNKGNVLKEMGDLEQALKACKTCIEIDDTHNTGWNNIGSIWEDMEDFNQAVFSYQRAIQIDPDNISAYTNLAVVLLKQGRSDLATTVLDEALKKETVNVEVLNKLAGALKDTGRIVDAINVYRKSVKINPNNDVSHTGLGLMLSMQGDKEEAISHYKKALKINNKNVFALAGLESLNKHDCHDDSMLNMEELYNDATLSSEKKWHLGFVLGQAYEELQDFDKAYSILFESNELKRQSYNYSTDKSRLYFDSIIKNIPSELVSKYKGTGYKDETPIFIIGMPRSGSSLVEQILASHSQVFGAGELNNVSCIINDYFHESFSGKYPDDMGLMTESVLMELGEKYIESIKPYSTSARNIVDKMPHNFIYLPLIKLILPNAKIIHCKRDAVSNCWSIYKHNFSGPHDYAYNIKELGEYYKLYQDFMAHFNIVFEDCVYDIKYEELVSDQKNQTHKLLDYCGLSWEEGCMSFYKTERAVATLSSQQVRQSLYSDSISISDNYSNKLTSLKEMLLS